MEIKGIGIFFRGGKPVDEIRSIVGRHVGDVGQVDDRGDDLAGGVVDDRAEGLLIGVADRPEDVAVEDGVVGEAGLVRPEFGVHRAAGGLDGGAGDGHVDPLVGGDSVREMGIMRHQVQLLHAVDLEVGADFDGVEVELLTPEAELHLVVALLGLADAVFALVALEPVGPAVPIGEMEIKGIGIFFRGGKPVDEVRGLVGGHIANRRKINFSGKLSTCFSV